MLHLQTKKNKNMEQNNHGFNIILKTKYLTNTSTMKPLTECHIHDMDKTCEDCYHFKKMKEFVIFIQTRYLQNKHMHLYIFLLEHRFWFMF